MVIRDGKPWFLAEAKWSEEALSPALAYFQGQTRAMHAFQVVGSAAAVTADAFSCQQPVAVPARTLLSQLL